MEFRKRKRERESEVFLFFFFFHSLSPTNGIEKKQSVFLSLIKQGFFAYLHVTHATKNLNALISNKPSCFLEKEDKKRARFFRTSSQADTTKNACCTHRGVNFTDGRFKLEVNSSLIHIRAYHVSHALKKNN